MSGWTHSLAAIALRGGTYSVVSQADLALNLTKLRRDGRLRVLTVTNGLTDEAAIIASAAASLHARGPAGRQHRHGMVAPAALRCGVRDPAPR
jgi:hypothetical protein